MPLLISVADKLPDLPEEGPTRVDMIDMNIQMREKVIKKIQLELPVLNRQIRAERTPRKIRMARALLKTRSDKLTELQARNDRLQKLKKELSDGSVRK